jgi:uncharacterized protein YndB with AHSA1/START domain
MTPRTVTHGAFTIERTYDASTARVFKAFADPAAKAQWFMGGGEWRQQSRDQDFRVGGREPLSGGRPGHPPHIFNAIYQDIVPDERIIYTYEMLIGDERISVSVATIEFKAAPGGTRLVFTEQGAFLDAFDDTLGREQGTRDLLDRLEIALRG